MKIRAAWLIILVVLLLTVAVKPLRQQAMLPFIANSLLSPQPAEAESHPSRLDVLRERAPEFVKQRHPNDPEMLLAAGLLTRDKQATLELLKQAAEQGDSPAAWAAYCTALLAQLPEWDRLGESGVDPTRPDLVAEEKKRMQEQGFPDRLDSKAAAPVLAALASWEEADPQNGLPLALETRLLYGLHQDQKAQARWEAAGARPRVNSFWQERTRVTAKLLARLGLAEPDAQFATIVIVLSDLSYLISLRQGARIAHYEGKVAQMQGRNADAIRWWNSTIALGRKLQDSREPLIEVLVGMALEGIGASPTWKWYVDQTTGVPGGPLLGGRIWLGPAHAFYVSQVGEQEDAMVRDDLVRAKVRAQLLRDDTEDRMDWFMTGPYMRGVKLVMFGSGAALFGALCLLLFLAVGTWRRKQADEATHLRPVCQLILTLAPFAPLALAAAFASSAAFSGVPLSVVIALVGLALAPLALIFLPLLAAASTRAPGAKLANAWRGNLRRLLPDTAAIAMLCFLALNLAAIGPRAEGARQWSDPKMMEMAQVRQRLGEKWENPPIPKDAWRAEYPKLKEQPL